ncbi:MAG: hypothetical protein KDH93_28025, partial [Rhodoferax sp.]|nr:hypothetical protein [Rhodoferax sp.]
MLRIVSERARRRYSQRHVDARVAQVDAIRLRCADTLESAREAAHAALDGARDHLWLPPELLARVGAVHRANVDLAQALHDDLQRLARDFGALPVDTQAQGPVPEPVAWEA